MNKMTFGTKIIPMFTYDHGLNHLITPHMLSFGMCLFVRQVGSCQANNHYDERFVTTDIVV